MKLSFGSVLTHIVGPQTFAEVCLSCDVIVNSDEVGAGDTTSLEGFVEADGNARGACTVVLSPALLPVHTDRKVLRMACALLRMTSD